MDPVVNRRDAVQLARRIIGSVSPKAWHISELVELNDAYAEWIGNEGFRVAVSPSDMEMLRAATIAQPGCSCA